MKKEVCKACKFYSQRTALTPIGKKLVDRPTGYGLCRVNAPTINPDTYGDAQWPEVSENDWCGKFEQKTN